MEWIKNIEWNSRPGFLFRNRMMWTRLPFMQLLARHWNAYLMSRVYTSHYAAVLAGLWTFTPHIGPPSRQRVSSVSPSLMMRKRSSNVPLRQEPLFPYLYGETKYPVLADSTAYIWLTDLPTPQMNIESYVWFRNNRFYRRLTLIGAGWKSYDCCDSWSGLDGTDFDRWLERDPGFP